MTAPTGPDLPLKAKLFRGLADPSRLAILSALRDGRRNVTQVVAATGLSQPNVSTHLNCLRCCGLVARENEGRFAWYRISSRRVLRLLHAADALLETIHEQVERCSRYEARRTSLIPHSPRTQEIRP